MVYIPINDFYHGFESCVLGVFVHHVYLFKRVVSSAVLRLHPSTEIRSGTEKYY